MALPAPEPMLELPAPDSILNETGKINAKCLRDVASSETLQPLPPKVARAITPELPEEAQAQMLFPVGSQTKEDILTGALFEKFDNSCNQLALEDDSHFQESENSEGMRHRPFAAAVMTPTSA